MYVPAGHRHGVEVAACRRLYLPDSDYIKRLIASRQLLVAP